MQALGAYAFLGLQRGKPAFLAHIPAALRLLEETLAPLARRRSAARRHSLPRRGGGVGAGGDGARASAPGPGRMSPSARPCARWCSPPGSGPGCAR